MNAITIDAEVRDYLEEVKAHLADLPDDELDDLTIDLEAHLAEVHAEGTDPLTTRLGSPAAYAAELRASAGFDRLRVPPPSRLDRAARRLVALAARPEALRARQAWRSFRPAWVAMRGWLLVVLFLIVGAGSLMPFQIFPIPHFGSTLMGLVAVALATVLSYAAAGRAETDRRWRTVDAGLTAVVAVLLFLALTAGSELVRANAFVNHGVSEDEILAGYPLAAITNIFAYDLDGNPLEAVLLYDQDGNPVDANPWANDDMEELKFVKDRFGDPIKNAYPVQQFRYAERLEESEDAGGAFYVAEYEPVPPPRVPLPATGAADAATDEASDPPPAPEPDLDPSLPPR